MKLQGAAEFQDYLEGNLKASWTPEQIAHRWKKDNPDKKHFSFKSIYKYLYSAQGQRLCKYLPSKQYYPKIRRGRKQKRQIIKHRVSIEKRPKVINERRRFGDFEADVLGAIKVDTERLVALLERKTRKLFAIRIPQLKYAVDGLKILLSPYRDILKSITLDNGPENARHLELGGKTYFCHAYAGWEKGQIENTFKRLRRFIRKKSSLKQYSDHEIQAFVDRMNNTPRKCLNWQTPNEVFNELLTKERGKKQDSRKS